jgi:DNA-binding FrmR family transcriptional regulator
MNTPQEMTLSHFSLELSRVSDMIEKIAGEWDGNESGRLEDQASLCKDILDNVTALQGLLDSLMDDDF